MINGYYLNDSEHCVLPKTDQLHAHSRTCQKYNDNECRPSYGQYFTEKTTIAKSLDSLFGNDEKQKVLTWRYTLLKQVKSFIDNNLNSAKVNGNLFQLFESNQRQFYSVTKCKRNSKWI